jgi:hypothetical protein
MWKRFWVALWICMAPVGWAAVAPEEAARQLMDFAQRQYPQYFPVPQPDQSLSPFRYRYYPTTGIYLGVVVTPGMGYPLDGVYVMGGGFGNQPAYVGQVSQFITPVDPASGGGGVAGPNNGCYDLTLLQTPGTLIETDYELLGQAPGRSSLRILVGERKTWEGHQAYESTVTSTAIVSSGGIQSTVESESRTYGLRTGDAEVTQYGMESSGLSRVTGPTGAVESRTVSKLVYGPLFVQQEFGLALGQSLKRTQRGVTTSTTTMNGQSSIATTNLDLAETVRWVSRESVTVPAGSFATCRFESTYAASPGLVATTWVIDGKGIVIRSESAGSVQQATSVRLNGQSLGR